MRILPPITGDVLGNIFMYTDGHESLPASVCSIEIAVKG